LIAINRIKQVYFSLSWKIIADSVGVPGLFYYRIRNLHCVSKKCATLLWC